MGMSHAMGSNVSSRAPIVVGQLTISGGRDLIVDHFSVRAKLALEDSLGHVDGVFTYEEASSSVEATTTIFEGFHHRRERSRLKPERHHVPM